MVESGAKITMRDVRLVFRNFKGEADKFTKEGTRTFGVILDPQLAQAMEEDGWNVKWLKPRDDVEDDTEQTPWLPVAIRFDVYPPRVFQITDRGRTQVGEAEIGTFDWLELGKVDLIVRARIWTDDSGADRVKAYAQSLYVTIEEDELEREYAELDQQ